MKAFPDWLLGVSFAATWTWAVSVLVGMAILREQGIIPFFIWFTANVAAIPLFGYVSFRWPKLWDQTRRRFMRAIMSVMLIFAFWINMTGINTIGAEFNWFDPTTTRIMALAVAFFVWFMVARAGVRWSVITDRIQWWLLYGSAIAALVLTIGEKGFVTDVTLKLGTYTSPRDWLLGLWTIPLLLTNPYVDGSFWLRARYAKDMKPYLWGFIMFFSYLAMVAVLGLLKPTPAATVMLYVVIFIASMSTMDSFASALHLTAGKVKGIAIGLAIIVLWLPVSTLGLLDAWLAMFSWYPVIFGAQVVTYHLEKRGILEPLPQSTLDARDAVQEIENEQLVTHATPSLAVGD